MSYYNLISIKNQKIHNSVYFSIDKQLTSSSPPSSPPSSPSPLSSSPASSPSSCYISYSLCEYLSKFKKQIEVSSDAWDNVKKYTNPYEFIHTLIPGNKISVSKLKPLSRSFYKMIELWKMFKLGEIKNINPSFPTQFSASSVPASASPSPPTNIKTFHLAEGPGGFIEATSYMRKNPNDIYYGMTLINDDPGCPGWKKSNTFLENNTNVKIINGEDGTGDILKIENYKYCKDQFMNSMDIITADGGIDVSNDFNKQEKLVSKLLVAEIIYAVTMQKKGGHFILKIFDIFSKLTVDMLYLLSSLYSEVYITKPYTSRLANSEKYIVCKNFLLEDSSKLYEVFCNEFSKLDTQDEIQSILNIEHDYYFLNKIEEINVVLGQRQLENIITTLNIISNRNNYDKIDSMKKLHIQKSIMWCEKHDISCVKLYSSNNIFLSNIYDDGTPISFLKNNNNNAFLKGKSSNFTSNMYNGIGGTYNKNKSNSLLSLLSESPAQSETIVNDILTNETGDTIDTITTIDIIETDDTIVTVDTNNSM